VSLSGYNYYQERTWRRRPSSETISSIAARSLIRRHSVSRRSAGAPPACGARRWRSAPSADVLERIAHALMLTDVEREHLFLLGLGRPPDVRYRKDEGVTPRLQRVLDALEPSPALIRNAIWDVVAWNRAATVMLTDYGALPPEKRNILRFIFLDPSVRAAQYDWHSVARFVVGAFRVDAARAGAASAVEPLVDELCRLSPEFKALWQDNDVQSHGEAVKHIRHPALGPLAFEYSAFIVDGRPDLTMVIYNPLTPADKEKIRSLSSPSNAALAQRPTLDR
jgi:MmyB-like transcription regulator ligand binding domain